MPPSLQSAATEARGRSQLRQALIRAAAVTLCCGVLALKLEGAGFGDASHHQSELAVILLLYLAQDLPLILPTLALLALAAIIPARAAPKLHVSAGFAVTGLTAAALVTAVAIRFLAFHNYDLALDEFMPRFQARIFLHGLLLAPLSNVGLRLHSELQPWFTYVNAHHALWGSHYRPIHSALLALAELFGLMNFVGAIMAAASIPAMAAIARRIWPDAAWASIVAPLLLILTPQFLLTAGSGFAFPAELAFNLVWLALFLRGRFASHCLAAIVGMFAIGLHQVHFHLLFAFPFLAALLAGNFGPRKYTLPYIVGYTVALPVWVLWPEIAVYLQTGDTSVFPHSILGIDYFHDFLVNHADNARAQSGIVGLLALVQFGRFWLWLSPAVLPLILLGLRYWHKLGLVLQLAAAGFALNLVVNQILMPNQMMSWGARYSHPVLGNVILFATGGLVAFVDENGWRDIWGAGTALALASLVLVGVRSMQVEAKVGPRAKVQRAIDHLNADVVIIHAPNAWFATDFVRNNPFLRNRPLIVSDELSGARKRLEALGSKQVVLTRADLTAMGLPERTLYEPGTAPPKHR